MQSNSLGSKRDGTLTGAAPDDIVSKFWQQWQEQKDKLYRCCLKLMNFNSTDAEDALSQAMLKAWEKVQKYAGKIDNLKAWLVQLTRNLCIDIIRQRSRGAAGVDSLEWVGATDNVDTASAVDTPEKALEKEEKATVIKDAIASLPERLRNTFILHFYQQRTHTEIAEELGITYDNVCKRISLARKELKERLRSYFQGSDGEVATVAKPQRQTPGVTSEKLNQREAKTKVAKEEDRVTVEDTAEVVNSTSAYAHLTIPEVTYVGTPLALGITAPEKSVAKYSIEDDCGSDKSVGERERHGLVQNTSGEMVVSWLSRIAFLPERLRNSFRLHFYQQRSHTEIAVERGITYDNVCKRISWARKELKQRLSGYFQGSDGEVATVAKPVRLTPGENVEKGKTSVAKKKVVKEEEKDAVEPSEVDINSTGAIANLTTPDVTSVGTLSALGITAPEKYVVNKAIDYDCGGEKSVGVCDSNGLVQTSCGVMVVSWLSRIASLPERLRNTFRLHFYQQRTNTEIAEELGITYDNVCKRISLARKELKQRLRGYFHGRDGVVTMVRSISPQEKQE
ncbi:MAG: sigma-70 family RNA polymerase sigma factor [Symploca sp. SIO2E9]|nr:sigma-70 family RNA polymerase sigma factor [Symploca sp. SIO2E9]